MSLALRKLLKQLEAMFVEAILLLYIVASSYNFVTVHSNFMVGYDCWFVYISLHEW